MLKVFDSFFVLINHIIRMFGFDTRYLAVVLKGQKLNITPRLKSTSKMLEIEYNTQ